MVKKEFVTKGLLIQFTIFHEDVDVFCSFDPKTDVLSIGSLIFLFVISDQFKNQNLKKKEKKELELDKVEFKFLNLEPIQFTKEFN